MCTLIAAYRQFDGFPLVVAANRDEWLDRPASPPSKWANEGFVAPRDEVAGGTWLGLTATGMFVGVTNRFGVPKDHARASRGTLVVEALRQSTAAKLHQALQTLSPTRFNAFHLLYADAQGAYVTWSDGSLLHQQTLAPGVHIVTERSLGGDDKARTELIQTEWRKLAGRLPTPQELQALMRLHGSEPLGGTCTHVPAFGYFTRSSMVLYLADAPERSRFFWAEGQPCQTPYEERTELLDLLARG
ncbi:MAG: NRDE family protein [Myxococcota bacterium]